MKTIKELREFAEKMRCGDFLSVASNIESTVNNYVENRPEDQNTFYPFQDTEVEKLAEDLILLGAWIIDRIDGKNTNVGGHNYNKSITKKVRKSIGYNY